MSLFKTLIADRRTIKMKWLKILTVIGAGSTFLLAAATFLPINSQWVWLMIMFVLANIGLNGAGVFYNALLPHLGDVHSDHEIVHKAVISSTKSFRKPFIKRLLAYETISETDFGLQKDRQFAPNLYICLLYTSDAADE